MAPSVAQLASEILHIDIPVHHIRLGQKTLVSLPCKEIRYSGQKGQRSKDSNHQAHDLQEVGLSVRVHLPALVLALAFLLQWHVSTCCCVASSFSYCLSASDSGSCRT